jgi:DNA-binding NtrC family response regulator
MMHQRAQPGRESILIVDDQAALCETLERFLRKLGYRVASSTGGEDALERVATERFDLVITDVCMPGRSGIELLEQIQIRGGGEDVIVMTAYATIEQSVEVMRFGASDYISKPFELRDLETVVSRVLMRRRKPKAVKTVQEGRADNMSALSSVNGQPGRDRAREQGPRRNTHTSRLPATCQHATPIIGDSPAIKQLFSIVERVATTDSSVFITGATGTGKELLARAIHKLSRRSNAPFIDINCSAIPETLVESELFGHERGTFTGANETRRGLFEEASGGTLFLDEVDALGLSAQAKLLRVIQERQLRRVGGRENIPINVRIISATNGDLHTAISEKRFRSDLLFRLRVVPLHMPELRERGDDVMLLVDYFLQRHAERWGVPKRHCAEDAIHALLRYPWPGNVRELENVIEYALAIGVEDEIGIDDLPPDVLQSSLGEHDELKQCMLANLPLAEVERRYIVLMFERYAGHQIKTASALGIDRRTLYRKLQQYKVINGAEDTLVNLF